MALSSSPSPSLALSLLLGPAAAAADMVALQERMLGPWYDCFGPWPVCPDSIVRRYA